MHHAEEVGGDSEAAVIEKPEGDFVIQTRDEEIPLALDPEIHVHVNVDLPGLVAEVAELIRRQEEDVEKAVGQGVAAEEQQFRVFTPGAPHERDPEAGGRAPKDRPAVAYGGRAQADNPALYVLRTGDHPVGKHDTPRSPHRLHDPRVGRGREDAFKRLTHQQKLEAGQVHRIDDEMREALDRLTGGAAELTDPGEVLDTRAWTVLANNLDRHLDEHSAYMPEDAGRRLKRVMQRQLQLFHEVGTDADPRALDAYLRKAINVIAYQEVSSWQRQLGDHGVRHITEDMELADDMLGSLQEVVGHVSAEDRLLASVSLLFHDIGYTAGAARESLAGTEYHHQYSAEYVRASLEIGAVFSPEQVGRMVAYVETHSDSKIDWVEDPVGSSIRLADNLALFAREKLPALFRYVPGALRELKVMGADLAAGETQRVNKRKARLRKLVDGAELSEPMREGLLGAVDRVSSKSPKYTLGMLAGERMPPRFDGQTMHVPVRFSGFAKTLQDLFDLGQEQFVKLAESYGMTREDAERGEFTFHNERGEPVLNVKAVGATAGVFEKHLPGGHDQKKHGRGRAFTSTSVQTHTHAEAMAATRSYLKQYADFAKKMMKREGWRYSSVEELLVEEGTWYTDEEYTPEEEEELLGLFAQLGSCKARECYSNAMRMAMEADNIGIEGGYAEGLAHSGLFPTNHAFFVLNGKPVDLTWGRTREEEDPMAGAARRGRQRDPKKLLQRARENLEDNAYVGVEVPIKRMYELIMERGYYGSVFEVYGDSKFPLLVRDGVPEEWKPSDTLTKAGPALWTLRKHPAGDEHDHDPRRRKGLEGKRTPLSQKLREAVLGDEPACTWCGTTEGEFDVDHMVPVKMGGRNARVNLQPACQTCNRARGAKRSARSQEWVRAAEDEALRAFMETALSRPRGRLAASMTDTNELFTADYEDPTDELELHDTPDSPHKEHDPRYGRGRELPSTPEEAIARRKEFMDSIRGPEFQRDRQHPRGVRAEGGQKRAVEEFFSTERLAAEIGFIRSTGTEVRVRGTLTDQETGEHVGQFSRAFSDDGVVHQYSFDIVMEQQKKGYSSEFKGVTHRRYAEAGFHSVELQASEIGRYAWAKMGYGFSSSNDLERLRTAFHEATHLTTEFVWNLQTPLDFAEAPGGRKFLTRSAAPSWDGFKVINEKLWEEEVSDLWQEEQHARIREQGEKVATAVLQRSDCPALYVMKHDTPRSPHREHDPRVQVQSFSEVGTAGVRENMVQSLKDHPEEARRIKGEAQGWLREQGIRGDTVTVYHITEEPEGSFQSGMDPYSSWTVSPRAFDQIVQDLRLERPRLVSADVPAASIAVAPNATFPDNPYFHQDEVLLDTMVPAKELRFGKTLTGVEKHDTPRSRSKVGEFLRRPDLIDPERESKHDTPDSPHKEHMGRHGRLEGLRREAIADFDRRKPELLGELRADFGEVVQDLRLLGSVLDPARFRSGSDIDVAVIVPSSGRGVGRLNRGLYMEGYLLMIQTSQGPLRLDPITMDEEGFSEWSRGRPVSKAPGVSESGAEPVPGYRLGSPPTAQPARQWRRRDGEDED